MSDAFRDYLAKIGRTPLLTAAQEIELGRQVQARLDLLGRDKGNPYNKQEQRVIRRGKQAADKMVVANLRLVVNVAKQYAFVSKSFEFMDLVGLGNIGLARAVEKYDPTKGYKFSTYAFWWIKQSITRGLSDTSRTIRLPIHIVERLTKARRLMRHANDGTKLTLREIAQQSELDYDMLKHIQMIESVGSLDAKCHTEDGNGQTLLDIISNEEEGKEESPDYCNSLGEIDRLLLTLNERDRGIIMRRYGLEHNDGEMMTLTGIGKEIGVTRERVRQIVDRSLKRMRYCAKVTP